MRRSLVAAVGFGLLLLATVPMKAEADSAQIDAMERLREAATAHPDDPDLAWAYARKLAASGEVGPATQEAKRFLERWPDRRPGARVEIARILLDADAPLAASGFLDQEIRSNPTSGTARFYRALALREAGDLRAADREFMLAARLEPALQAETLLARALGLFDVGQDQEAVDLLVKLLRIDPTGDIALRARLLLRERDFADSSARFRADTYVGFEFDDNVTLASAENEVPASNRQDFRGIWGFGGSYAALRTDRASLLLGYRFDQTEQDDLDAFNLLSNAFFVSGTWKTSSRVALRMDAVGFNTLQDFDNALSGGSFRPSMLVSLGPNWGVSRAFGHVDVFEYDAQPLFESFERDALAYTLGLEHNIPLRSDDSLLSFSGSWQRTLTQAGPSGGNDRFDGDFDYDRWLARASAQLGLPFGLRTRIDVSYSHDRYHNDNLSHAVSPGGTLRKRRDDVLNGRIRLNGPIVPHVRWEVYWSGARRISNVDLFDYDKQIVGALVRISTDD